MHEMAAVEQAPRLLTVGDIAEELRLGRQGALAFLRPHAHPGVACAVPHQGYGVLLDRARQVPQSQVADGLRVDAYEIL